jgi:hypothetical protein
MTFCKKISFFILIAFCSWSCIKEPYLYDSVGFDPGTMPDVKNPRAPVKVTPDYYRQNPYSQNQKKYYQQPYQVGSGGSRFYSNPYAFSSSQQYHNYDADQYYIPPSYSRGVEQQ